MGEDANYLFQTFIFFLILGSFFIPLFLIIFLYIKIFLTQSKMATNRRLIKTGEGRKQGRLFGILSTLNSFQLPGNREIKHRIRGKGWTGDLSEVGDLAG